MEIQNNRLIKKIHRLYELCKRVEEMEIRESRFNPPADDEEILNWEHIHGITIPESYKEWLRFSNGSIIRGGSAQLLGVKNIVVNEQYAPEDLVIIGHLIGDGELLCFSKESGKIVRLFEGRRKELNSIEEIIDFQIMMAKDELHEDCVEDDDECKNAQESTKKNEENPEKRGLSDDATAKLLAIFRAKKNSPEGLTEEQTKLWEKYESSIKPKGEEDK